MNCRDRVFPSWDRRGGCASKKKARSLRSGADGVVIMVNVDVVTLSGTDHPVCALIRRLRSIFFTAQPPLLSEEGNTLPCNSFTPSMTAATVTFSFQRHRFPNYRVFEDRDLSALRNSRIFIRSWSFALY